MIWKEFTADKLLIFWNGRLIYMRRFDGRGRNLVFDLYGEPF